MKATFYTRRRFVIREAKSVASILQRLLALKMCSVVRAFSFIQKIIPSKELFITMILIIHFIGLTHLICYLLFFLHIEQAIRVPPPPSPFDLITSSNPPFGLSGLCKPADLFTCIRIQGHCQQWKYAVVLVENGCLICQFSSPFSCWHPQSSSPFDLHQLTPRSQVQSSYWSSPTFGFWCCCLFLRQPTPESQIYASHQSSSQPPKP